MKKFMDASIALLNKSKTKLLEEFDNGKNYVQGLVNDLTVFASIERNISPSLDFDEKHYFVIPDFTNEIGFNLHTTRHLPAGTPEVNDLPKRRIFHFPDEHYEALLREQLLISSRETALEQASSKINPLEKLANDIDALDNKLTYGMLAIGALATLINPLVGAGIAAKALVPGATGLLNKHGLRPIGEKLTKAQTEKALEQAEKQVLQQFSEANTLKIVNPLLQGLLFALETQEAEFDPLLDINFYNTEIKELHGEYWRKLTELAIFHVYQPIISDPNKRKASKLGPEDIRWLNAIFQHIEKG